MSRAIPTHLAEVLERLDYAGSAGLATAGTSDGEVSQYAWRDLRDKVRLDAAFFHDGVPLVGFAAPVPSDLAGIRRRLWNYGRVPLLVTAVEGEDVEVYNALSNPLGPGGKQLSPLAVGGVRRRTSDVLEAFSRRHVISGEFASRYKREFRRSRRVETGLLSNLKYLRRHLTDGSSRASSMDVLIGGSLVATYLQDRGVLDESHLLELADVRSLENALTGGRRRATRLFEALVDKFNGDVFGAVPRALAVLTNEDLRQVSALLRGDDLPTGQASLWPYDFSVVPTDLVSSVYEQLLDDQRKLDATHYTPRILVDLILDEVLPPVGEDLPSVADLSCGSGVFLAEAFRRLVYRSQLSDLPRTFGALAELMTSKIFGVDINGPAASVTAFGLYLSLLEQIDPPTIWTSVVLPQLVGRNIQVADAFAKDSLPNQQFDIIVGNPPWGTDLTDAARSFVRERAVPIGDQQIAEAFTWLAVDKLSPNGKLGLVMPAKAMLHNRRSAPFRQRVFQSLNVKAVIDLSAIRHSLFEYAVSPTSIIIAEKTQLSGTAGETGTGKIVHVTPRLRALGTVLDALVIAPEDVRHISHATAVRRPDIWKLLLWGSTRDVALVDRLASSYPNLGSLIAEKHWAWGQGFKEAPRQPQRDSTHLIGLDVIEPGAVKPLRVDPLPARKFSGRSLSRFREREFYSGPLVLIPRTLPTGRLAAALYRGDAIFSSNITAISGRESDLPELATVVAIIVSSLGRYWHFMTSVSWGVERETVETNELLTTPIALPTGRDRTRLLDMVTKREPGRELWIDLDQAVFDLFALSDHDRLSITNAMAGPLTRFESRKHAVPAVSDAELERYCSTVRQRLAGPAAGLRISTFYERRSAYVLVAVNFGKWESIDVMDVVARVDADRLHAGLSPTAQTTAILVLPAGFLLDGNSIYLVKTQDADRWSYEAALDDADRIFAALAFGDEGA